MNKSWEERLRETDAIYKERQKELEQIGISVESSGIKVEKDRFYLVNLNADPTLNELLVYYVNVRSNLSCNLQNRALIGCPGAETSSTSENDEKVDIVLQGLGVHKRHAWLEVAEEAGRPRLFVEPCSDDAR